mgnify:CR=1 FL=1
MKHEIIFIIIGVFIGTLGILIKHFKLYNLIAGYNTMSSEEKAVFNIEKFALMMRNVFMTIGVLIISSSLIDIWLQIGYLKIIVSVVSILVGVIYLNIQGDSLKNSRDTPN